LRRKKLHLPTNEIRKETENEQDKILKENQRRNHLRQLHKRNVKHLATNRIFRERNRAIKDRREAEEEDVN
jgi:hypothetical protein